MVLVELRNVSEIATTVDARLAGSHALGKPLLPKDNRA